MEHADAVVLIEHNVMMVVVVTQRGRGWRWRGRNIHVVDLVRTLVVK
jgi:hypothetical protein